MSSLGASDAAQQTRSCSVHRMRLSERGCGDGRRQRHVDDVDPSANEDIAALREVNNRRRKCKTRIEPRLDRMPIR